MNKTGQPFFKPFKAFFKKSTNKGIISLNNTKFFELTSEELCGTQYSKENY